MTGNLDLDPFYRLTALESVGSTNDLAKELAGAGAPQGTLLWAREQTSGRGRHGRHWSSPKGNLYASLVLRPGVPADRAAQLSFVAAVAMAQTLATLMPADAPIRHKWPNDILVGGRKIAGILLESAAGDGDAIDWLVVGMGVNVDSHPEGGDYGATSLRAQGVESTPEVVLAKLCDGMLTWRLRWLQEGFAPVRAAWHGRAAGMEGPLRVEVGGETLEGTYLGIDDAGALVLDLPGRGRRLVTAGEVRTARWA